MYLENNNINKEYVEFLLKQNILIVGATLRSGVSVANTLYKSGITSYTLNDSKNESELRESIEALDYKKSICIFGRQDKSVLEKKSLIILSPGVPLSIAMLKTAKEENIDIISEIEFAYNLIPNNDYIAITGTDGKTTTTTLVYEIIKSYKNARLVGNVGNTFSKEVFDIKRDETIVIELSSFQLESVQKFKPNISVILNITEDHLDRYNSVDDYFNAKKNIYKNEDKNNFIVLNKDNFYTAKLANDIKNTNVLTFSCKDKTADLFLDDLDNVHYKNEIIFSVMKRKILGNHNRENIAAASLICLTYGIPIKNIESICNLFLGLEHRMEYVDTIDGVVYVNDSKATALNAVECAIKSFKNIILIMGGRNKGIDFSGLKELIEKNVKCLILTGEAAEDIDKNIKVVNTVIIKNFDEAFYYAKNKAVEGDTVLLSPGCSSFDRFENYEERGRYFKCLVRNIKIS